MKSILTYILQIAITVLVLLVATGCQEEFELPGNGLTADGKLKLSLRVELPDATTITTRSTDPSVTEKTIDVSHSFVLVFDAPEAGITDALELSQKPAKFTSVDIGGETINVELYSDPKPCYLLLLVNLSAANTNYVASLSAGTITLGELKQALRLSMPGETGLAANNLPMTGYSNHLSGQGKFRYGRIG